MVRRRRIVGGLTLITLILIAMGVTGFELPVPRIGSATSDRAASLPGVRALAASTLVRVGAGAPAGGELAFMAVEPSGNLVVSDANRASVLRFDPAGHLLSEWGPRLGALQLVEPAGVAVSGDSYYVVDRGTPRIFRLDASGQPQAMFDLGPLSTYGLNGLAVDASGNVYAADTGRNRILVFSPAGRLLRQVGRAGSDLGGFVQPMMLGFAVDGSFFVSDWENGRIERFDSGFQAIDAWPIGFHPFGVAVDQIGRVFAPDFEHRRVEVYSPRGAPLAEIGEPGPPTIDVAPKQVAVTRTGPTAVYVLGSDAIERIDLTDTPPPPQSAAVDDDVLSVAALVLMLALVGMAVMARQRRRRAAGVEAAPAAIAATAAGLGTARGRWQGPSRQTSHDASQALPVGAKAPRMGDQSSAAAAQPSRGTGEASPVTMEASRDASEASPVPVEASPGGSTSGKGGLTQCGV